MKYIGLVLLTIFTHTYIQKEYFERSEIRYTKCMNEEHYDEVKVDKCMKLDTALHLMGILLNAR